MFSNDPSSAEQQEISTLCISPSEDTLAASTDRGQLYSIHLSVVDLVKVCLSYFNIIYILSGSEFWCGIAGIAHNFAHSCRFHASHLHYKQYKTLARFSGQLTELSLAQLGQCCIVIKFCHLHIILAGLANLSIQAILNHKLLLHSLRDCFLGTRFVANCQMHTQFCPY